MESGLELKILKKIALITSPENDLMLTDDLLNKYRQTPPISDCQILDDSLATKPCLGRFQALIRTDSLEIIYPVQDRGAKNHTLSSGTSPYSPYRGVPPGIISSNMSKASFKEDVREGWGVGQAGNNWKEESRRLSPPLSSVFPTPPPPTPLRYAG